MIAVAVTALPSVGTPCVRGAGRPLQVTAHLAGPVCLPSGTLALDALLAAAVAEVEGLPPADEAPAVIEIPVEREPGGRFHLCSFAVGAVAERERQFTNQRPVVAEVQWFGDARVRRIDVSAGRNKATRKPREALHLADDRLDWWCVGDESRVRALLDVITAVGHKRSVGNGRVLAWSVREVTPWGPGFPVELDGAPLRPLPLDWPGLRRDWSIVQRQDLTYPFRAAPSAAAVTAACPEPLR